MDLLLCMHDIVCCQMAMSPGQMRVIKRSACPILTVPSHPIGRTDTSNRGSAPCGVCGMAWRNWPANHLDICALRRAAGEHQDGFALKFLHRTSEVSCETPAVQVDPVELWKTKPFGRVIEEGYFKGRGADDDKGGLMTALAVSVSVLL